MTDDIRRRAACDKCHSQKIRCPRQPGQESCSRCVKSGSKCVFSPFRQKKIPLEDPPLNPNAVQTVSTINSATLKRRRMQSPSPDATPINPSFEPFNVDDLNLDWLPESYSDSQDLIDPTFSQLNFESESSNMFPFQEASSPHGVFSLMTFDPNPMVQFRKELNFSRSMRSTSQLLLPPDVAPVSSQSQMPPPISRSLWAPPLPPNEPEPESDIVKKLSQLSSDLFAHSKTVPPISIHDPDHEFDNEPAGSVKDYSKFVLEELFRLTQNMIDIYPHFLHTFLGYSTTPLPSYPFSTPSGSDQDTSPSDSSTSTNTPPSEPREHQDSQTKELKPPLDHSSILLLLSCHIRVIEIYEHLFKHMEVCIAQGGVPMTKKQNQLKVPTLSIGSYCPPPSSSVPMQMLLLIQFASQLLNYATDLAEEIEGRRNARTENSNTIKDRRDEMTENLTRATAVNVRDRAGFMAEELGTMRSLMLQAGIFA